MHMWLYLNVNTDHSEIYGKCSYLTDCDWLCCVPTESSKSDGF